MKVVLMQTGGLVMVRTVRVGAERSLVGMPEAVAARHVDRLGWWSDAIAVRSWREWMAWRTLP